jgi:predicted nucleic acid-binding protein
MTLTLDANVWVSVYDSKDRFHILSTNFLSKVTKNSEPLNGPSFVLVETSCALVRRTRDATDGQSALALLRIHPLLTLYPLTEALLANAARLGIQHLLRGADALYAATAELTNARLISWDMELVRRANAITPSGWLLANP